MSIMYMALPMGVEGLGLLWTKEQSGMMKRTA